jgi:hypothetical protein
MAYFKICALHKYVELRSTFTLGYSEDMFKQNGDPREQQARAEQRQVETINALQRRQVPPSIKSRLELASAGKVPWIATLTPAELRIAKSHGIKPIAAISATCWLNYGFSWTLGHAQGWNEALSRLRNEAAAAGANAVLDVKMRTIPLPVENSMDFTLVGTAVSIAGMPKTATPIVATVPALEFAKLLEADIVPTGIAIGAHFEWLTDTYARIRQNNSYWAGNVESTDLSRFLNLVRNSAYLDLRTNAQKQGNGVLAHLNFNELIEVEVHEQPTRYLGRHIVVATTVNAGPAVAMTHDITMAVDMHAGQSPLTYKTKHHQSYSTYNQEGAI